jgi:hypothetical protein
MPVTQQRTAHSMVRHEISTGIDFEPFRIGF